MRWLGNSVPLSVADSPLLMGNTWERWIHWIAKYIKNSPYGSMASIWEGTKTPQMILNYCKSQSLMGTPTINRSGGLQFSMCKSTINHHVQCVNPLEITIFHSTLPKSHKTFEGPSRTSGPRRTSTGLCTKILNKNEGHYLDSKGMYTYLEIIF